MAIPVPENKIVQPPPTAYRGRFAPSPTGPLHFGSLVAAAGSYLQAHSRGGSWHVRIEDIDPPREVPGAARAQLETLKKFGLTSQHPVIYQRANSRRHLDAVGRLVGTGRAFHCGCTRSDLPESGVYPGTCRGGLGTGRSARSIRFLTEPGPVAFIDRIQGPVSQDLSVEIGDFIIRRADGLIAYQLAVVADDAAEGITEVVRGADLLDSTPRQIALYRALNLPVPAWMHLPLIVDERGEKLSKSLAADPVNRLKPAAGLRLALRALGHEPPGSARSLDAIWRWARSHWHADAVPAGPCAVGVHPATS